MVLRRETRRRGAVAVAATAAPAVVWLAAVPIGGLDIVASMPAPATPGTAARHAVTVGLPAVVVAAATASLAGWVLFSLLERLTPLAGPVWLGVALPAFILSLAGPFMATTTAAMLALAGMHLAVAAVLVPGLALSWQRSWPRDGGARLMRVGGR
ncbi:DUF6069 family protein [Asanoa sp. WMMD1127]|uniref:DUF6069 family protein n=1 Tax=Asanoa sp. WMMD1127 TaxID=3016107 RepID=UPI0024176033|nr:DUF6069 family protein [Asanoa sp. WMMD1127]MDG4824959.1 DUF6069 family protein [Asanoa sp. WMMD1127]